MKSYWLGRLGEPHVLRNSFILAFRMIAAFHPSHPFHLKIRIESILVVFTYDESNVDAGEA